MDYIYQSFKESDNIDLSAKIKSWLPNRVESEGDARPKDTKDRLKFSLMLDELWDLDRKELLLGLYLEVKSPNTLLRARDDISPLFTK